ncbi:MAG TPA: amidase [Methylomirabilota bacterium]|nr:amidase [Methylomirabilota bacterium]
MSVPSLTRRAMLGGALSLAGAGLLPRVARGGADELDFASALDAARAIRAGKVSSVELTNRMLARIAQHNGRLNAIVTLTADTALSRARAADAARARGEWWGPFHGVPVTIKDTYEVDGVRTTAGLVGLKDNVAPRDAVVVTRLKDAGAVVLGKTNVPPGAADWQSYNPIFGQSNNPWDLGRTPGGSTGGGAAALAAGLCYLEPGSDLAGSIRIPAHFCGLYGHKPTLDLVPQRGHIPPPPGIPATPPSFLPVAGPLARSAADLRAAMEVLGGPDEAETRGYRWALPPARGARLRDYRIGYVLDHPQCAVSQEVGAPLAAAVEALRKAGATLAEGWPPGVNPSEQYETYFFFLAALYTPPARDEQLDELRRLASVRDGSPVSRWAAALTADIRQFRAMDGRRRAARAAWSSYFRTHDAFLMPTAFVTAFPHDHSLNQLHRVLTTPAGLRPYLDLSFWIAFASLAGLPATTAPVGRAQSGLPVGIQIVGPYLEDATPIDLAGRLTEIHGGFTPPPGF